MTSVRPCHVLLAWLLVLSTPWVAGATAQSVAASTVDDVALVVPFSNVTGTTDDDWIGSGIAETVAADLAGIPGVSVIGRDTLAATLDPGESGLADRRAAELGRSLGARWVVEGGYQRVGDRLRITARVVEVGTGAVVRTAKVDGVVGDLFALQDRIVGELRDGFPVRHTAVAPVAAPRPRVTGEAPPTPPRAAIEPVGGAGGGAVVAAPRGGLTPNTRIFGPAPPVAPEVMTRDAQGLVTWRATPLAVAGSLDLDGRLDEGFYETVAPVSGFVQGVPDAGAPATEKTEAWVFYDGDHIYVAARCYDSAPESQWVANEMRRDTSQLRQNDTFAVMFDTFYDRRNGMAFYVNPIGGFSDFAITDEGNPNMDWNPVWEVRTGRFEGGWTVEMEFPFKSLRYQPGTDQVWGIQLRRAVRRKNEWAYLTPIPASVGGSQGIFRVSDAGTLVGIEAPGGARNLEIKPYGISSVTTNNNSDPRISNDPDGEFGLDVKYGITQNLTADFTYNTDFAQVEVDEQQVNLTRFSLFFPEKREFFLEGRGLFDFGRGGGGRRGGGGPTPTVFFSRRVGLERGQAVPILGGGRLTGKVGSLSIGAVNIQTDDAPGVGALSTNFTAVRVKQDILRRSQIGGIFTGRSVSRVGDGSNEVYGLDAAFSFYENVNFASYFARSQTPGLDGNDVSYQTQFSYNADRYGVSVDHLLVGDNFNPEVGFLRRDDFRRSFASFRFSPRPRSIRVVRQFRWQGSLNYIENGAGDVETRESQFEFNTEFENSDQLGVTFTQAFELLVDPFRIASGVTIPVGGYSFADTRLQYTLGGQRKVSGNVSFQRGEFFGGTITAVGYSRGRVELTRKLSVEPSISINRVDLPQGLFTTRLASGRLTYTFNPRMSFSGLLQFNSSNDSLSSNLRFRWEYQAGSELFLVYSDQRDTGLGGTPLLENRAVVFKVNRLFRF